MSRKMEIKYPELLPDLLHQSADNFEKEAKMAMAVKLFEMQSRHLQCKKVRLFAKWC